MGGKLPEESEDLTIEVRTIGNSHKAIVRSFLIILFLILAGGSHLLGQGTPEIQTKLDSSIIVVGEKTYLTVWVENLTLIDWPSTPKAAPLVLKRESQRRYQINGRIREGFRYLVSSFEPGIFKIPPFELPTRSGVIRSTTHTLRVFPVDNLETHGIKINGDVSPYLTGVFLEKKNPYLGETQNVEAKLYLSKAPPHLLTLSDGNVINIKKDGLAAWRFTTTEEPTGHFDYDGHRFTVYTYSSSVNALRDGPLVLGPGTSNVTLLRRKTVRGGFATGSFVTKIDFPAVELNVQPLPEGAPPGFGGAVGVFTMEVRPLSSELELGESLTVETRIIGSGNIDQFSGPQLIDVDEDWKQFKTMTKPSGGERRLGSGTAEFSHVLRPLKKVLTLPPYRFVYFDPLLESYEKKESLPLPITITEKTSSKLFKEETLALLPPGTRPIKPLGKLSHLTKWSWQIVPLLISCWILGIAFRNKIKARQISSIPLREFENKLNELNSARNDRARFFLEAARFVTEQNATEGFEEIFKIRDGICFRKDSKSEALESGERKRILKLLRTLSPLILLFIFVGSLIQTGIAGDLPPEETKAKILAAMDERAVKEHFHNLAICEKELGNLGEAALWSQRYQLHGGDNSKLMAGLPGVHARPPQGTEWLFLIPKWLYLQILLLGIWSLVIVILTAWNIFGNARKNLMITFSISTGIALVIGTTGMGLYPKGVSFEPLSELSVVTEIGPLRSQPFEGANTTRENTIGSLCRVETVRAGWAKIELADGYVGWIRQGNVSRIAE